MTVLELLIFMNKLIEKIFRKCSNIIANTKSTYRQIRTNNRELYRVEEIDTIKKTAVIHCHGVRILLKLSINEIIKDATIIFNLSAIQAAYIGYYYGKLFETNATENLYWQDKSNFMLRQAKGEYKILSQERNGDITYINIASNIIFIENPMYIFQNKNIINKFDSSQACYIGVLVGINLTKEEEKKLLGNKHKWPKLSIVK